METVSEPSRQPEPDVGDLGEDFVEWVCEKPLGKDFLFRGQMYRDGRQSIELSDLFVLVGDTAILIEVKTADRIKRPNRTEDRWVKYAKNRLKQASEQIERGAKALRGGLVKTVTNERQGTVIIDPEHIKHIYGIAVVDHPTLDKWGRGPVVDAGGIPVSILTTTHTEVSELFTELSTVGDLVDYIRAREGFLAKHMMTGISELDLLAFYKVNPKKFRRIIDEHSTVLIDDDNWKEYAKLDERKRRAETDRPSFLVDKIIDILHEARHAKLPHIERRREKIGVRTDATSSYATIATELALIRRLDRRVIGESLFEKSRKCTEQGRDRWFANSPMMRDGATCVFLISTSKREERMTSLEEAVMGAVLACNARWVIGIATEPVTGGYGFSVDAFMFVGDPEDLRRQMPTELRDYLHGKFGPPHKPDVTEFGGSSSVH